MIATRGEDGKVKLKQSVNLVSAGVWEGTFWGSLIGLKLFFVRSFKDLNLKV